VGSNANTSFQRFVAISLAMSTGKENFQQLDRLEKIKLIAFAEEAVEDAVAGCW
jgi:hypothetical protein